MSAGLSGEAFGFVLNRDFNIVSTRTGHPSLMAYPVARFVSMVLGRALYGRIRKRRHAQVMDNFGKFLPDRDDHEALYESGYRQLIDYVVEEIHLRFLSRRRIMAGCEFTNLELIENHLKKGHKIVVTAAHQGNLDWVWLALCLNFPKQDMAMVGRKLNTGWLDRHLKAMRERFGQPQILNDALGRVLLRRKSVPDILCLVTDLEPVGKSVSRANAIFLGQPVAFYNSLPRVASRFGMHVIYLEVTRLGYGRFNVVVHDLSPPPSRNDGGELQARYVREVENSVARRPADWLFWWLRLIRKPGTQKLKKPPEPGAR